MSGTHATKDVSDTYQSQLVSYLILYLQSSHPWDLFTTNFVYSRSHAKIVATIKHRTTTVLMARNWFGGSSKFGMTPGGGGPPGTLFEFEFVLEGILAISTVSGRRSRSSSRKLIQKMMLQGTIDNVFLPVVFCQNAAI